MAKHWLYRPTEVEREALTAWMEANPEFDTTSKVVREAVMQMMTSQDLVPVLSRLQDTLRELRAITKQLKGGPDAKVHDNINDS